ncbi:EamA domain-containing protein [Azospirillaceae bacterium]
MAAPPALYSDNPMKTFLFLAAAVFAQAAGNVCLTIGVRQLVLPAGFEPALWGPVAIAALSNPWLWGGAAGLIAFTLLFTLVLSWTDLSLALPVISVEIVVYVALGSWLLGEPVSSLHWLGTVMVAGGVALVAGTAGERRPEAAS